jgi:hypothetical protein
MTLDRVRELLREYIAKPWLTAVVGFIIGLIIGLPILGWWAFPVKWIDASPANLREDLKQEYVVMMIDSYAYDQDSHLALMRWKELGPGASDILKGVQGDPQLNAGDVVAFSTLVGVAYQPSAQPTLETTAILPTGEVLPGIVETTPPEEVGGRISTGLLLGILCLLLLVVGGAIFYFLVIRRRTGSLLSPTQKSVYVEEEEYPAPSGYYEAEEDTPIAQYMTTYMLGDDLYDDSFSIDSPSGEFLGECGVGISETIGVGDPKKVTAFEVWLFDKNDIQTITKVLMSDHAFNDEAISQRLASKGEPLVVEPGKSILLETATLQLEVRVVDMNYGQGALPDSSFFERLTLELSIWPKMQA